MPPSQLRRETGASLGRKQQFSDWSLLWSHEPLKEKEGFALKPRTNISETRGEKKNRRVISGNEGQKVSGCRSISKAWVDSPLQITKKRKKKYLLGWHQLERTGSAAKNSCSFNSFGTPPVHCVDC